MKKAENINLTQVERLLEKYFEGGTTLEEEQALRDYFTSTENIPAEMGYARAMFGHFTAAASETGKPATHPAETIGFKALGEARPRRNRRNLLYYLAGAISTAAVITLVILLTPGTVSGDGDTVYCYINGQPVTDPELAVEYSQIAFAHISEAIKSPIPDTPVFEAFEKIEYITDIVSKLTDLDPNSKQ